MTRNEAYLTVVEGWLRDNRGIVFTEGAVDDLCDRIAVEVGRLHAKIEARKTAAEKVYLEQCAEIECLRAALGELLSGHDNLYVAHFGPGSNPHDDIAAKPARRALEQKP